MSSRSGFGSAFLSAQAFAKIAIVPFAVFMKASPTRHVEFAHIYEGLTVKIEEASPSLALLEDERIPVLKIGGEPLNASAGIPLLVGEESATDLLTQFNTPTPIAIERIEREAPVLMASSIQITPVSSTQGGGAGSVTSGESVPGFGEAFRKNTIILSPSQEPVPSRRPEDLLIDTMTASNRPSTFRRIAAQGQVSGESFSSTSDSTSKEEVYETSRAKADQGKPSQAGELVGLVELSKGLALTDQNKIEVSLRFASETLQSAVVDPQQGTYRIQIPEGAAGMLVAELSGPGGRVLGRGRVAVEDVLKDPSHRLLISPAFGALAGMVQDAYEQPVARARIKFDQTDVGISSGQKGQYQFSEVAEDSQFILSAFKDGYWGSRIVGTSGLDRRITLFPTRMIEGLHDLAGEQVDPTRGVIWGRVENSGKPVTGAAVELSDATAVGPIYFNQLMLPDRNLKSTSANGLFAYIRVEPGVHAIKSKINKREFPARIVSVEASQVSSMQIENQMTATGRILVFDALDGQPLDANVRLSGSAREASTSEGQIGIKYYRGPDLMFVEADAGEAHHMSRITIPRSSSLSKVPMVRKAWASELSANARINRSPNAGIVIGFIQNDNFTVGLPNHLINAEIVYFDGQGRFFGRQYGPAGGGFAIFNLEPGLQQISILPAGGGGFASRVIHSDIAGVHVLNVQF